MAIFLVMPEVLWCLTRCGNMGGTVWAVDAVEWAEVQGSYFVLQGFNLTGACGGLAWARMFWPTLPILSHHKHLCQNSKFLTAQRCPVKRNILYDPRKRPGPHQCGYVHFGRLPPSCFWLHPIWPALTLSAEKPQYYIGTRLYIIISVTGSQDNGFYCLDRALGLVFLKPSLNKIPHIVEVGKWQGPPGL